MGRVSTGEEETKIENRREGMLSEIVTRGCRVRAESHLDEGYVAEHFEDRV
jgi:hypothetical protein